MVFGSIVTEKTDNFTDISQSIRYTVNIISFYYNGYYKTMPGEYTAPALVQNARQLSVNLTQYFYRNATHKTQAKANYKTGLESNRW